MTRAYTWRCIIVGLGLFWGAVVLAAMGLL